MVASIRPQPSVVAEVSLAENRGLAPKITAFVLSVLAALASFVFLPPEAALFTSFGIGILVATVFCCPASRFVSLIDAIPRSLQRPRAVYVSPAAPTYIVAQPSRVPYSGPYSRIESQPPAPRRRTGLPHIEANTGLPVVNEGPRRVAGSGREVRRPDHPVLIGGRRARVGERLA